VKMVAHQTKSEDFDTTKSSVGMDQLGELFLLKFSEDLLSIYDARDAVIIRNRGIRSPRESSLSHGWPLEFICLAAGSLWAETSAECLAQIYQCGTLLLQNKFRNGHLAPRGRSKEKVADTNLEKRRYDRRNGRR
jgi:hypothetical protein